MNIFLRLDTDVYRSEAEIEQDVSFNLWDKVNRGVFDYLNPGDTVFLVNKDTKCISWECVVQEPVIKEEVPSRDEKIEKLRYTFGYDVLSNDSGLSYFKTRSENRYLLAFKMKVKRDLSSLQIASLPFNQVDAGWKTNQEEILNHFNTLTSTQEESTVELKRVWRSVLERKGQSEFKTALLSAYQHQCAISQTSVVGALEAAHIRPHSKRGNMSESNGLLLRSDLHKLFDLNLIAINPSDYTIHLAPSLKGDATYGEYEGCVIRMPQDKTHYPSQEALTERWESFNKA